MESIQDIWNQYKKPITQVIGIVSMVIGVVFLPLPFVLGWPFLVFGAYCLKIAQES